MYSSSSFRSANSLGMSQIRFASSLISGSNFSRAMETAMSAIWVLLAWTPSVLLKWGFWVLRLFLLILSSLTFTIKGRLLGFPNIVIWLICQCLSLYKYNLNLLLSYTIVSVCMISFWLFIYINIFRLVLIFLTTHASQSCNY